MSRPFRFAGSFPLAAPPEQVIAVLRDAERWPQWWPQIRSVERYDERRGLVTARSALPFSLRIELTSTVDDPDRGVLRADLARDLVGWIEFRVAEGDAPDRARVTYDQECDLAHARVRRVALAARPLLQLNHSAMMRTGMRRLAVRAREEPAAQN